MGFRGLGSLGFIGMGFGVCDKPSFKQQVARDILLFAVRAVLVP